MREHKTDKSLDYGKQCDNNKQQRESISSNFIFLFCKVEWTLAGKGRREVFINNILTPLKGAQMRFVHAISKYNSRTFLEIAESVVSHLWGIKTSRRNVKRLLVGKYIPGLPKMARSKDCKWWTRNMLVILNYILKKY